MSALLSNLLITLGLLSPSPESVKLCKGYLPENDMRIPVSARQVGGISKEEFDAVLDKVEAFYAPIISAKGGTLQMNRDWADDTVNAYANRYGNVWIVSMFGGLARHPAMNKDGFMMVACHETGHHLGGAPKVRGFWGTDWATNEGQADYYATLRCLRNFFTEEENAKFVEEQAIDPFLRQSCEQMYSTNAEKNLCIRSAMAGHVGVELFRQMKKVETEPRFDTPDPAQVSRTDDDHPALQCRLDTYFQGALCTADRNVELSNTDPTVGTCVESAQRSGFRPRCWYAP